ncbi:hydrogenase-4 membrane subunit HyfE [Oxalobacteraceae bacterium GrIS 1.18]
MDELLFFLLMILMIPILVLQKIVISGIKCEAPEAYEKAGRPMPFLNTPATFLFMYGFVMNCAFKSYSLTDSLYRNCRRLAIVFYLYHLVFIFFAVRLIGK